MKCLPVRSRMGSICRPGIRLEADDLWTRPAGKSRWIGTTENLERDIMSVSDEELWRLRTASTHTLIQYTRDRLSRQLSASGAPREEVDEAKRLFDPNILTLCFARRFAVYKRPNLLLQDPERLRAS